MPIPKSILERIETFRRNLDSYLKPDYKEAQVRQEFIDPLFSALGWDVANTAGYAEAYKDVVNEDTLRISGAGTTAPDYSFRIGGTRKFFVEAKKPSVYLKDDPEPAAQLRRYSWSAKLALGLVTDFQEFAIYDTRIRPREGDKASVARIFYCTYEQFPEKWDEIAGIFSREAVLRGSFDKFAATTKGKRGTAEFDDAFLADLEGWRQRLAENLALRNRALTQRELNFAVQRTLDRIIFLRIAEDRGIEPYGQLQALTAGGKIYPRLCEIFERADFRYNSGLFHFAAEKGRDESPDRLTLGLAIDDAPLKEILGALYYPKSPYAFAVIPAEILGHVYEQFLGKVIHLTEGHRARVEEKPEVRKAGGVYYTPAYIVDYIVRQTLGPLVEGKAPKQVEKLRVLDPACGSGSFLLGAFDFLLDWHLRYYLDHDPGAWTKKRNPPIYETSPNARGLGSKNWQLTTAERKRILTANLHGVDIDAQAVEVTKLSLLLKVLEGEARELQGRQLDFHRVLPDLGHNIKCGNSLIGSDFYAQPALPEFDDEARYKINAFDWAIEFKPIVVDAGGFDAVIGNPPYVVIDGETATPSEIDYLNRYEVANYKTDLFHLFIERGTTRLRKHGRLGFIVPNPWLTQVFTQPLRKFVLKNSRIDKVAVLEHRVFEDANVDTCLLFLSREEAPKTHLVKVVLPKDANLSAAQSFNVAQREWQDGPEHRFEFRQAGPDGFLVKRIVSACVPLGSRARASLGCQAYNSSKHTRQQIEQRVFHAAKRLSSEYLPELAGSDVSRYSISRVRGQWIKYGPWLHDYRPLEMLSGPRVLIREIPGKPPHSLHACYIEDIYCHYKTVLNVNPAATGSVSMKLVCGLLNSRLATFLFPRISNKKVAQTFPRLSVGDLRAFPIPAKLEPKTADQLVAHVERMLKLHTDLATAKAPDAQTHLSREIAASDRAIDQLVYQLYALTPEEIALVEQADAPAAAAPEAAPMEEIPRPPPPSPTYAQAEADAAHHFLAKEDPPQEE